MIEIVHRAMACDFVLLLPEAAVRRSAADARTATDVAWSTLRLVDELEAQLSVYRRDSEVSRINDAAGQSPVAVSPDTYQLVKRAVELSGSSGGAFDITAAPLIELWGIGRSGGVRPTTDQIDVAKSLVGSTRIELCDDSRQVFLPDAAMKINLGAIGKGFAVDRVADRMIDLGLEHFLIHAGQSTVRAAGDMEAWTEASQQSIDPPERRPLGWKVGLAHPTRPGRRLAGCWLRDAAMSTSGSGKQYFHHRGRRYGHVLDPRTGMPAGRWLSLSLVQSDATTADAMSTALFVEDSLPETPDPLFAVAPGGRLGDVTIQTRGPWVWADPPMDHETC